MRFGLLQLAQAAVGHGERIVDVRGLWIHRQGFLQMLHGPDVVLTRRGCPSQADPRPGRAGLKRQRLCEQRLGRLRPALCEVHFPERDQRRHIVGSQREGLFEGCRGLRECAPGRVQVPEIVRPASVARRQRLRVEVEGLWRVAVAGRHQHVAHLAVRLAQLTDRTRMFDGCRQRRVSLTDLVPHGGGHVGEIGQRGGPQHLPVGCEGRRFLGRGRVGVCCAAGHRGGQRPR